MMQKMIILAVLALRASSSPSPPPDKKPPPQQKDFIEGLKAQNSCNYEATIQFYQQAIDKQTELEIYKP
jgi:hypothetical protein